MIEPVARGLFAGIVVVLGVVTSTAIEVVTLITAMLVLATAIAAYRTRKDVKQIHVLVNSEFTAKLNRIEQLTEALTASDTPVPAPSEMYGVDPEDIDGTAF